MAIGTIHPAGRFAGPGQPGGNVRMAFYTVDIFMNRIGNVSRINFQGYYLAIDQFVYAVFFMTFEAGTVGNGGDNVLWINFMRRMAIRAGRYSTRFFFPEFLFNYFGVDLFNFSMALHTG